MPAQPLPERRRRGRRRQISVTPGAAVVLLGALVVAGLAARDAVVPFLAARSPSIAVKLAPHNATAIVNLFSASIFSPASAVHEIEGWTEATRRALRADPLNARAIRLFASLSGQAERDLSLVQGLMALSERVSRRDEVTQMWLIEDAARRGDIESALRHYNRVLTTHPSSAGQLVPVLASAMREPLIRQALLPYVKVDRPWVQPMLSVAIDRVSDPAPVLALFRSYRGARTVPAHASLEQRLLDRLVKVGRVDDANVYAASAGAKLANFGISEATIVERFRPLAWTPYQGADGVASLEADGEIMVSVDSNTKIVAATRVIPLAGGDYILGETLRYANPAAAPTVTWTVYCRTIEGSRQFWTQTLPAVSDTGVFSAPLKVPRGCAGVQFDLEVTGADSRGQSEVAIGNLILNRR